MADGDSHYKPKGLGLETAVRSSTAPNQANPSKFNSQFLYKALTFAIFLVILPLFPSEAPEFVNKTIPTRGWELLHLLFVGIAVSYGLFSWRNDESEKETHLKFDSAQSYVSRLLSVSSVFDDEAETPCGSDYHKVETWSSQYSREEPAVMVAEESSFVNEQRGASSRIREKPLHLPVRSLKYRVSDSDVVEPINNKSSRISGSFSRSSSNPGTKRFSRNSFRTRNEGVGDVGRLNPPENCENDDDVVLRSPIPWRSRSGRMEMKEEGLDCVPFYSLPPSMEEAELSQYDSRSCGSQISASSTSSLQKKLSPSSSSLSLVRRVSPPPSLSSESQAKGVGDASRKGVEYKIRSPPPTPPLPVPPSTQKTQSLTSNSRKSSNGTFSEKEYWRCFTNETKDFSRGGKEEFLRRANSEKEAKPRTHIDPSIMGKSVRTFRSEPVDVITRARKMGEDVMKSEKRLKEVEPAPVERTGRKAIGSNGVSISPEKQSQRSQSDTSKPTLLGFQDEDKYADKFILGSDLSNFQEKEKNGFDDNFILASDKDSENEDDDNDMNSGNVEAAPSIVSDGGPDVDKKADEFIAKFREQIRLQRINSFKRSSKQLGRKSPR